MLCTKEIIQKVWEKGTVVTKYDAKSWRQDLCGAWISRFCYGCQESKFGWEISYVRSQTQKGGQELPNLRPMQWRNNIFKQFGDTTHVVKAVGVENCEITQGVIPS
jgi:hypothetical protein